MTIVIYYYPYYLYYFSDGANVDLLYPQIGGGPAKRLWRTY
jgi:hypothetical protein